MCSLLVIPSRFIVKILNLYIILLYIFSTYNIALKTAYKIVALFTKNYPLSFWCLSIPCNASIACYKMVWGKFKNNTCSTASKMLIKWVSKSARGAASPVCLSVPKPWHLRDFAPSSKIMFLFHRFETGCKPVLLFWKNLGMLHFSGKV